jgi:hypothetical protein
MLPLLLAYLFPRIQNRATFLAAFLFLFWKSPSSQALIDLYNQYSIISISRVVDYSDLLVLAILPLPHYLITNMHRIDRLRIQSIPTFVISIPAMLALMATSPPANFYYTRSNGNLTCYRCHTTVNYDQDEIVKKLRAHGIAFDSVSTLPPYALAQFRKLRKQDIHLYRINTLVLGKDTLRNLELGMRTIRGRKTKVYFNGMQVRENITNEDLEKKLKRYYRKLLFDELRGRLN